jgi:phosphopantothenoylcysteine synthetase/decarboxylase
MRVLTNRSSGELAIRLANALADAGFTVEGWLGRGATSNLARKPSVEWGGFDTNQDLLDRFERLEANGTAVAMIFQTAALADFEVDRVEDTLGRPLREEKISSRIGEVRLILKPAVKVLPRLRQLFPGAYLCGWKFEAGDSAAARQAGLQQIRDCHSDACVVNGPALQSRFEWHRSDGSVTEARDRESLAASIVSACIAGECRGPSIR